MEAGSSAAVSLTVGEADLATAYRSGEVAVLATPRVLALAEEAAVTAVRAQLAADQTTVGAWVELAHLRPTPPGATVVAHATLEAVDGRRLEFSFRVLQDGVEVARGRHRRAVVDRAAFG